MVLLTFTPESSEKILAGKKCATTRPLTPYWQRIVEAFQRGKIIRLQVYQNSPRNGGTRLFDEDVEPRRVDAVFGNQYDGEMFLKDGFETSEELVVRLRDFYDPRFCHDCQDYRLALHFTACRKARNSHAAGPELSDEEASHWFDSARWAFIEFPTPIEVSGGLAAVQQDA